MTKGPLALTSDASDASCLAGWEQKTGFLHKEAEAQCFRGPMEWPWVAERVLGIVGTKVGCVWGLLRRPVWLDNGHVKLVCESILGPDWGLLGSGSCPQLSQPHLYWFLWVLTSQAGTSLRWGLVGDGETLCFWVSDAHLPPGVPGLCGRYLLQHGQLQVLWRHQVCSQPAQGELRAGRGR